jgi:hypothetical protein
VTVSLYRNLRCRAHLFRLNRVAIGLFKLEAVSIFTLLQIRILTPMKMLSISICLWAGSVEVDNENRRTHLTTIKASCASRSYAAWLSVKTPCGSDGTATDEDDAEAGVVNPETAS